MQRVQRVRRVAAYGVCRDGAGRVLLVRASASSVHSGMWLLPGGGVEHGEHPAVAAVREIAEETGYDVVVDGLRAVLSDVDEVAEGLRHQDRIVFDVHVVGGGLRSELDGGSDLADWVDLAEGRPLLPYVARVLGQPYRETPVTHPPGERAPVGSRLQRFAAYGLVTATIDGATRVLLTRISTGFPGAGMWHLPGGGTDFGEDPAQGLRREIIEETDQRVEIVGLLDVSHRRDLAALGPEGVPLDFHGVRVVFEAVAPRPTPPVVTEDSGSTAEAAWFTVAEALALSLTNVADRAIRALAARTIGL